MFIDEVQLGTMLIMMWSHSTWGLMLMMDGHDWSLCAESDLTIFCNVNCSEALHVSGF